MFEIPYISDTFWREGDDDQYVFWKLFPEENVSPKWVGRMNFAFWTLSGYDMIGMDSDSISAAYQEIRPTLQSEMFAITAEGLQAFYHKLYIDGFLTHKEYHHNLSYYYLFYMATTYNDTYTHEAFFDVVYAFGGWPTKLWSNIRYGSTDAFEHYGINSITVKDVAETLGLLDENGKFTIDYETFARCCLEACHARLNGELDTRYTTQVALRIERYAAYGRVDQALINAYRNYALVREETVVQMAETVEREIDLPNGSEG